MSFALCASLVSYALCPLQARGDAASGTWTGNVGARGNYYWERSTRVVAPAVNASVASPSGVRVEGTYLIDAITSASVATGTLADEAFTEKRHDAQAGLGYEVDFGAQQLDVSARARISREPDYHSQGAGFSAALSLDHRNTVLRLNGYFIHDDVYRVLRNVPATGGGLIASKADPVGDLNVASLGWSWDQVLTRTMTLTLGYDLALLYGFQANAYRQVPFPPPGGGARPEQHPEQRTRNAPYLWLAHFIEPTRSTLRVGYRLYRDDWDILAHTADVRIHQEIGDHLELRFRYRYYTQSASSFYRDGGNLPTDRFVTADPKMSRFHDQTFGLKMRLALDFLSFTALDGLRSAVLDWGVEYVINTNRYGNGVIAQGGLIWSF